jgi:hypothetical protein
MSEGQKVETGLAGKVRGVALLQWTGPRAWADRGEEGRVPERLEKALRDGHFAWFRVGTGEGVPTSRCWMVFNAGENPAYWGKYGVTRVVCVGREGVRGYWSEDGKRWWRVEECGREGKAVRVECAGKAYRAACGAMPWEVPFFDGSGRNRERLERMYGYVAEVLGRGGMAESEVDRRLERAEVAVGFNRWAARGRLYGGRFKWEKGEVW